MGFKENIRTVGELRDALKDLPENMRLSFGAFGYAGRTPVTMRPNLYGYRDIRDNWIETNGGVQINLNEVEYNGEKMCEIENDKSDEITVDIDL